MLLNSHREQDSPTVKTYWPHTAIGLRWRNAILFQVHFGAAFIYDIKKTVTTKGSKNVVVTLPPPNVFGAPEGEVTAIVSLANQMPSVCIETPQLSSCYVLIKGQA